MPHNNYLQSLGQKVKLAIIEALLDYYKNISTMGFPGDPVQMPVIREAYGSDLRSYPAIFVKIISVTPQPLGIGNDFVRDVWSDDQTTFQKYLPGTEAFKNPVAYRPRVVAERYGKIGDVSLQIQIWGDTTPVRNRVADETMAAFEYYMRSSLERQGIVLQNISEGEETDFAINESQMVYTSNINLTVNAEIYFDVPVSSVTEVIVSTKTYSDPALLNNNAENQ